MEKVRPWCGQTSDRGRLVNRTESSSHFRILSIGFAKFKFSGREVGLEREYFIGSRRVVNGVHFLSARNSETCFKRHQNFLSEEKTSLHHTEQKCAENYICGIMNNTINLFFNCNQHFGNI